MGKRTLIAQEVADVFFSGKVSYGTILKMARAGNIPHFKVGRKYFFRWDALINWQLAQEQQFAQHCSMQGGF